jgi:WhiB family redox-sensing transcriptional regulator
MSSRAAHNHPPRRDTITITAPRFHGAACDGAPNHLFFPPDEEHHREPVPDRDRREDQALAYCYDCPIRPACLTWALTNNEPGIWGGTTDRDRARLRRRAA